MSGWQRVHLDEIPELPGVGGDGFLTWRPVRLTLDLRAFGTNAYTANEAGVDVVERARFTLDGESFDAPAGTYVRVTDPKAFRAEAARKAGELDEARRILAECEAAHPESAALHWWRARLEVSAGDEDAALAEVRELLERAPEARADALDDEELGALVSRLPEEKEE